MNAVVWILLALALALAPTASTVPLRVASLAASGRLVGTTVPRPRRFGRLRLSGGAVLGMLCAVPVMVVTVRAGPALGFAVAVAAAAAGHLVRATGGRRRSARATARLSAGVQLLVAELRAGSPPAAGFRAAAEAAPERADSLRAAARLLEAGDPPTPALADHPALRPLALAWEVAARTGAAPAEVLGRVADDVSAEVTQRRVVELALAGPRSSALLLAGLPLLGLWLGAAMGAAPLGFLLGTPVGRLVGSLGIVLDALGAVSIQRLLDRAARP